MNVYVCVGSSCHLKNSKGIIDKLTKLIEENNIKANVELKALSVWVSVEKTAFL